MAVFFRAVVMLVVLVGLPSAWVYYGPLPAGAQQFVNRMIEIGKSALEGETDAEPGIAAPLYSVDFEPVRYDPQTKPAAFAVPGQTLQTPTPSFAEVEEPSNTPLQEQLEPHLAFLRNMGAAEYTLEEWGQNGQLVRFRCAVSAGSDTNLNRQFEAVAADSLAAVRQVVGEVSSWQNARGGNSQWR